MATISTNATGNWSAGGTWVGGVKPQAGDDVVLLAGHIVTLDENATFATLTLGLGATGHVLIPAGSTRIMTGDIGWGNAGNVTSSRVVLMAVGTGTNLTINGNITRGGSGSNRHTIDCQNMISATLTINGNVTAGATGGTGTCVIISAWTGGTVTINGNITGPTTTASGAGVWAQSALTTNFFVTGNVDGGVGSGNYGIIYNGTPTTGVLTMVGNAIGNVSTAVTWAGAVSFIGQISAPAAGYGLSAGWGTVTVTNTLQSFGSGVPLQANPPVGQTLTVTAPAVVGGPSTNAIYFPAAGTLNLTAPVTGSSSGVSPAISQAIANSTLNLVGSVAGGPGGFYGLHMSAAGQTTTVTGDVTAGSAASARGIQFASTNGTLTVNGNVTAGAGASAAIQIAATGPITINGTATPTSTASAIGLSSQTYNPASYYVYEIKGGPWSGSGSQFYAFDIVPITFPLRCKRFTCGANGALPLPGGMVRMIPDGPENRASFYNATTGLPLVLTDSGYNVGHPDMADVREGVSYALGAGLGTLAVPLPSLVSYGVPTDNTTGTAILTQSNVADAIWDAQRIDHADAGSFGAVDEWAAAVDLAPVQAVVDAINTRLPADPADQSDIAALIGSIAVDLQPVLDAIEALDDVTAAEVWEALSAEAANRIADHVLRRKQALVLASADGDDIDDAGSLYGVNQMHLHANTTVDPGSLTVYNADDTVLEAIPLNTGPAQPVRGTGGVP